MSTETRWIIKAAMGHRAVALAAAIALPAAAASAQTAAPTNPVLYKGKGVGGDNSYFNRYEEDFSFLRDPSKSGGPYGGPSTVGGAATVGKPGTYIGSQPQLDLRWAPVPHVTFDAAIGQMVAGPVIKNAGGQNDTYALAQVTLQF